MNVELLSCLEVATAPNPSSSVIWLHGLGADGHDFADIVPQLRLPPERAVRFVFPHAPMRRVTINGGMAMRAWYDVLSLDFGARPDVEGIRDSTRSIEALVEREVQRGIAHEQIVIAGFSQGGAIALETGLNLSRPLAGIIGLSTYFPTYREVDWQPNPANRSTPILMCHGTADTVVVFPLGELSRDHLLERGCSVTWHSYTMPHSVCAQEIDDISDWLCHVLV